MKKKRRTFPLSFIIKFKEFQHDGYKWDLFIPVILIFIMATWSIGWAVSTEYVEVKTLPLREALGTSLNWHVTAYHIKEGEGIYFTATKIPAKICFWYDIGKKEQLCFKAVVGPSEFPQVEELSLVQLEKGKEPKFGVLFVSTRFGAIEPLHLISIWVYNNKEGTFKNILPSLSLNFQSEYKLIPLIPEREKVIFVTANRIWTGGGEMLYGPHKFKINIYDYTENGVFKLIGEYVTKTKYPSFEDVNKIDVISHELKNIQKYFPVNK
jgi:hypothetical protein